MTHRPHTLDASGLIMGPEASHAIDHVQQHETFCTGLEPLLAKVAGVLRPLAIGAGVGAFGLAALTKNTMARDEKQRRNSLVYTPMSGAP